MHPSDSIVSVVADLGDWLYIVFILGFAVLSWLGKLVKGKDSPEEAQAADEVEPVFTMEPVEPPEWEALAPPRPVARPRQIELTPTAFPVGLPPIVRRTRVAEALKVVKTSDPRMPPLRERAVTVRSAPPRLRRSRRTLAFTMRTDLAQPSSLQKAVVLSEILGPPVGLRPPSGHGPHSGAWSQTGSA